MNEFFNWRAFLHYDYLIWSRWNMCLISIKSFLRFCELWITEWQFHFEYPFSYVFPKMFGVRGVIYAKFLSKCDRQNYIARSALIWYVIRKSMIKEWAHFFPFVRFFPFSIWEIEVFFSRFYHLKYEKECTIEMTFTTTFTTIQKRWKILIHSKK